MANITKIKLPSGNEYTIKDSGALQLTGGTVTGPVNFGNSVSIDEATIGDLVVNGSASFTNNINANTINSVAVGSSPKFTDTVTTVTTSGSGNAVTAITASDGALTVTKGATFLTSFTETDPTVPSWAKASTKPSYTYTEVGAAAASHSHGYVGSGGTVSSESAIENGDKLVIIDSGDSNKIAKSTLTFDRSSASTKHNYLSAWGTWESVPVTDITVGGTSVVSSGVAAVPAIPTKVSDLTNDSGFVTTDEKLKVGSATSGHTYYPILNDGNNPAQTQQKDSTGFSYGMTSSTTGYAQITLGNTTAQPTSGSKYGKLKLYGTTQYDVTLQGGAPTASRTITLPDKSGTIALTSDIPDVSGKIDTATLTVAGWSGGQQTVSVSDVTSSNAVIVSPAPASHTAYCTAGVYCSAQASGTLTFTCSSVPSAALTVNVLIL